MAMANNKTQCFTCNKEKITYSCKGCSKEFCFMDLAEHHKRLNEELHHIIDDYNAFKERINQQIQNPQNHALINQIDQWEIDSIEIIQQKAKECREILIKLSQTCINDIEKKFNDLTEQIQQLQKENDFNEINFNYLTNQLIEITEELTNPSSISIQRESQSFMKEISIVLSKKSKFNKWKQNGITVAGGNGEGKELNQVNRPIGILIDKKKNIFIADSYNHRVVEWKYNSKEGKIVAGGNGEGHRINQLNYPTDVIIDQQNHSVIIADYNNRRVIRWLNQNQRILIDNIDCYGLAMDKNGFLYISDYQMDEVRRWKMGEYNNEGILVAGGNDKGQKLNHPTFINNNRVVKWKKGAKQGTVVAGGNGQGRNLNQLSYPRGVIVDHLGHIYVADSQNHRIMRWCDGEEEGEIVVGGNGKGSQSNQLNNPYGLSFDNEGNLYVVDGWNHRIQKFDVVL
ncbi:unnamed protein product [Adineta steineri]|uniref:Uncharacterized protein n=1 Tax=Adineta steineri TaxID=433720 RepID=A0A819DGS7_9BILA|nr:unnamed protein product [Adineta steineri]CAF3835318.1 unnamed protein product [Adineta steineri]